jgi:hypothetical protein
MSDMQAIADGARGEFTDAVLMRGCDRLASLFARDGAMRSSHQRCGRQAWKIRDGHHPARWRHRVRP